MWTRKGRSPNGVSTTFTMASATAATSALAGTIEAKPSLLLRQLRQCRTIHSLRASDVDVIQLSELFGRERFGRTKNHVSGVVNDHVEATVLGNDLLDGCVTRFLRRNVQFDGTQVDIVILGELFRLFDLWRITAPGLAHACIDSVACFCQSARS